jgi:integrase
MAIRQKGLKWQADVTVKGQRLPRFSFDTKGEAEAWASEARLCALQGRPLPEPGVINRQSNAARVNRAGHSIKDAMSDAMKAYWKGKAVDKKNSFIIHELCEFFGSNTLINELNEASIDRFVADQEAKGRKGQTVNHKLVVLSRTLKLAYRKGHIDRLPLIERKSIANGRVRFLSESEEQQIIDLLEQWAMHDWRDAFVVFVDTGMRMSELWRVKPEDVNWQRKTITLWQTKTGKPRAVPMTKRVQAIIHKRCETSGVGTLWGNKGSSPTAIDRSYEAAWRRVRAHLNKENDPGFIRYITRHTCASRLVQAGADLSVVRDWMGHSTIITTMRYAHLAPKHVEAAVNYLEKETEQ